MIGVLRRGLLVAAVLGGLLAASPVSAAPRAPSADAAGEPCSDNAGITVVIDFQELEPGTPVQVRCAPAPVSSGFQALSKADISYQTTARFAGFVCKIAGRPSNDPCRDASPASAYWSYWVAPRGGQWCYSNFGAGSRTPPPGSVEGWSFSLNKSAAATPPPRLVPPAPISGAAPNPIPARDCTAPGSNAPTTTTTVKPATTTTHTAPAPGPTSSTTKATTGTTKKPSPGATTTTTKASATTSSTRGPSAAGSDGSTSSTDRTGRTIDDPDRSSDDGSADPGETDIEIDADGDGDVDVDDQMAIALGADRPTPSRDEEASGLIDLSDDGNSPGSPVGAIAVGLLVALGIGSALITNRRRRQDAPDIDDLRP